MLLRWLRSSYTSWVVGVGCENVIHVVFPEAGREIIGSESSLFNIPITRLAIIMETMNPIAVPWIC